MSLHLQVAVGDGLFLLDAAQIVEICPPEAGDDAASGGWPMVDLRRLLAAPAETQGSCIRVADPSGTAAVLIVDRVDGLTEIDAAAFRALPPIGPLGVLIDGIAMRPGSERPLLRLRGELAITAAAALG